MSDPTLGYYKSGNGGCESTQVRAPPHSGLLGFYSVVATLSGVGASAPYVFDSLEGAIIHEVGVHHL